MLYEPIKKLLSLICIATLIAVSNGFAQKLPVYPPFEPDDPTPLRHSVLDKWSYLSQGLDGSFGSIDVRYERDVVPRLENTRTWSGTAWRGEKVNLQIVLWSNTAAWQVHVLPAGLINARSAKIDARNIQSRFVRYLLSDDSFYECDVNTQKKPPILVADILDNFEYLDMPAKSTRPVWITLQVPADADPGDYQGQIIVTANGGLNLSFQLNLKVLPLVLPPPARWRFELDLWQNPWAVARYHDVRPWSDEHVALLKPLLKMLADAGQKYITTTIIHHPWNAQTYDPYQTMIKWIKQKDDRWSYDYSIFDRYVELCMECGIGKYISCYSMICFRNNYFRYFDAASGDFRFLHAEPGTREYEAHWRPFLADFVAHLAGKGWLKKTLIAMDERPYELMKEILDLVHRASPDLRIALASEDWQDRLHPQVYSYSVSLGRYTRPEIITERSRNGLVSTFYPCCVEPMPNNYPHSDPAESAWMGWLAAADGFSGFLRWAYNSWVENPLWDARYSQWNAGECFLVYPDSRSSIRFERLREGIQDYEKIRIVREKLAGQNGPEATKRLKELDLLLSLFSYKNAQKESVAHAVNEGKAFLDRLSRDLPNP